MCNFLKAPTKFTLATIISYFVLVTVPLRINACEVDGPRLSLRQWKSSSSRDESLLINFNETGENQHVVNNYKEFITVLTCESHGPIEWIYSGEGVRNKN
jgi:hypothetical protein